jgi:hypothetical protein
VQSLSHQPRTLLLYCWKWCWYQHSRRRTPWRKCSWFTVLQQVSSLFPLSCVLRNTSATSLSTKYPFSDMPRGSVVFTGSAMVQSCLGEDWNGRDMWHFLYSWRRSCRAFVAH